ncbi:MAG: haloacid dehalogenase-like hydrolase [Hyphomonadaceae bacterium]|nr:haloacid dehalogenase-like hydrolase [Hyphomonadaceae bacterium]
MIEREFQSAFDGLRACIEEANPDRRFFVDFDFTLLLTNSTDAFLRAARPRPIYWLLLKAVGLARPWVFRGANGVFLYRDAMRLQLMHRLRPSLAEDYEQIADQVFERYGNHALIDLFAKVPDDNIAIVSFGLKQTIERMLRNTRFKDCAVIASEPDRLVADRARGKLEMLREANLLPDPDRDAVITDSRKDDQDLLDHVRHGFHIKWLPTGPG